MNRAPAGPRRLFLVRHGETVGGSSIRYFGRTDVALSEAGRAQMRATRALILERFGPLDFARVFSSELARAREGARIIAGPAAQIIEIADFNEVDFGDFEGLTNEEICARFPVVYTQWNRDRLAAEFTYPDGENRGDFNRRVESGAAQMLRFIGAHDNALVVAHRGVIRVVMRRLCSITPQIELGSLQTLEWDGGWRVTLLDARAPASR